MLENLFGILESLKLVFYFKKDIRTTRPIRLSVKSAEEGGLNGKLCASFIGNYSRGSFPLSQNQHGKPETEPKK